jgi:hypothetical protein
MTPASEVCAMPYRPCRAQDWILVIGFGASPLGDVLGKQTHPKENTRSSCHHWHQPFDISPYYGLTRRKRLGRP